MRLKSLSKVHFVGLGGIGVSALAQFLYDQGVEVTGSDMMEGKMTKKLLERGIKVEIGHKEENVDETVDAVIYSLAITEDNPEMKAATNLGIPKYSYPHALGILTHNYKTIAVAGTHGKTTTTSMIAKILLEAGLDPSVIVGSTVDFLDGQNYRVGRSDILVIEACEYHSAFLNLDPDILVITNVEHDHFDAYPTEESYFKAFCELLHKVNSDYDLVINTDYDLGAKLAKFALKHDLSVVKYDKSEETVSEVLLNRLGIIGEHNRLNAMGALLAVRQLQVDDSQSFAALREFKTPGRRLEVKEHLDDMVIYSDYAHHPTEVKATLSALREKYGVGAKIMAIFQAHQHKRTKELLATFIDAFEEADKVVILPIFAARDSKEDKREMTVEKFVDAIGESHNNVGIWDFDKLVDYRNNLEALKNDFDVVVVMGAGDVEKYFF